MESLAEKYSEAELFEKVLDAVSKGGTIGELQGLTEQQMEGFYSLAYTKLQSGVFNEAEAVFKLLCILNHLEAKYWLGLGLSRQQLEMYELAAESYAMGATIEPANPIYSLQAAICLMHLEQKDAAKLAFEAASELASLNVTDYFAIGERAKVYLAGLQEA